MTTTVQTQLDVAAQVLDLARGLAGTGAEIEVRVERQDLALTRFANSYIHQNVADSTTTVRLRLHLDGRTAAGSTTLAHGDALRELVERTVAASRLSPADPGWPGLTPPTPTETSGNVDEATAAATPHERAERIRAFVDAAGGLATAGYLRTRYQSAAFVNSAGQSVAGAGTEAGLNAIARTPTSDGLAAHSSVRLSDLDGAALGARAAAKARAGTDPIELPAGEYEVVLEPDAVADVLRNLAMWGFNGRSLLERRSFADLGAAQFDARITVVDDPVSAEAIGLPFDAEGTPKRQLDLVSAGITSAVSHDRRTAAQCGTDSTGHAVVGFSAWGPFPLNPTLLPAEGGDPVREVPGPIADSSTAALVAGVRRGLLVTDFWYTRVLDPRPLVVTGLTRNGLWLVEDGEVTTAVQNLRFTQAYPRALGPGAVLGVGTHAARLPDGWGGQCTTAPALHLASWNFTGGASG